MTPSRALRLFFGNIDLIVSGLCIVALVGLTGLGVVMRYALRSPLSWLEEVQILLFVWVAFFGASVAFRFGGHIAIEAVVELFPVRWQRVVAVFDAVLTAAVLILVFYWEFSRGMTLTRTGRATSILNIPLSLNYFGVAAASLLMLIHFIRRHVRLIASRRREKAAAREGNPR